MFVEMRRALDRGMSRFHRSDAPGFCDRNGRTRKAGPARSVAGGVALLLSLWGGAPLAQEKRPWIDPPADLSVAPAGPKSSEASPAPTENQKSASPNRTAVQTDEASPAAAEPKRSVAERNRPASAVASARKTRAAEAAVARKKRSVARSGTSRVVGGAGSRRFQTVEEALAAGYEVQTLRTIEFPGGRRITVLTRPDPETMRDLLERPHTLVPP